MNTRKAFERALQEAGAVDFKQVEQILEYLLNSIIIERRASAEMEQAREAFDALEHKDVKRMRELSRIIVEFNNTRAKLIKFYDNFKAVARSAR